MPAESAAALRYMKLRLKICNKSRLSAIVLHSKLGALFFNEYALNVTRALAKNVNTNNGFKNMARLSRSIIVVGREMCENGRSETRMVISLTSLGQVMS